MTLPDAFVSVPPRTPTRRAEEVARTSSIKHLLVAKGDRVLGTVCLCELIAGRGGQTVRDRMNAIPWALPPRATLADAARLMRTEDTDLALVVDGRELVGLVTDGDLHRVGVPPNVLARRACLACRSTTHVCRHPRNAGIDFCLDCLERGTTAPDSELGAGD
jgi:hypothetical protein